MKTSLIAISILAFASPLLAKNTYKFTGKLSQTKRAELINIAKPGDSVTAILEFDSYEADKKRNHKGFVQDYIYTSKPASLKILINGKEFSSLNSKDKKVIIEMVKGDGERQKVDHIVIRSYKNTSPGIKALNDIHMAIQLDSKKINTLENIDHLPLNIDLAQWKPTWGITVTGMLNGEEVMLRSAVDKVEIESDYVKPGLFQRLTMKIKDLLQEYLPADNAKSTMDASK